MEQSPNETIQSAVANIKVSGIATMAYWSMIRTNEALYFVKTGSALGLGVGTNGILMAASVIGDIVESSRAKNEVKKDIQSMLESAQEYLRFTPDQFNQIKTKKGLLGGKVIFPNGKEKSWNEAGVVKFTLSGKKFRVALEMLGR